METSEDEELERISEAATIAVGIGAVEADRVNVKHMGVFV